MAEEVNEYKVVEELPDMHTDPRPPCDPCLSQDSTAIAKAYCVQCREFMCDDCVFYHRKFTATREHTITDPNAAPPRYAATDKSKADKKSPTDCPTHAGQPLESFCRAHKVLCCSACLTSDHKGCSSVSIAKASKGYADSHEFMQITDKLKTLKADFDDMIENKHRKATSDTKTFSAKGKERCKEVAQAKLLSYVDTMAVRVESTITENIRRSADDLVEMREEIRRIQVGLDSNLDLEDELFVLANPQIPKLTKFEHHIMACNERLPTQWIVHLNFEPEKILSTFVSLKPTSKYVLPVKRMSEANCSITSVECLVDGRYVVSDASNKTLKMFKRTDELQAKFVLSGKPLNVSEIEPGRIAVSIPEENKLQLLSVANAFTDECIVPFDDTPTGMATFHGKIFVTFKNNLRILDREGTVIERISKGEKGEELFQDITCIVINGNTDRFYIVDSGYLFGQPIGSIREMNTRAAEAGYYLKMQPNQFRPSVAIDEDNSLYICTPNGIAHVTADLVQLQMFVYSEFHTPKRLENPPAERLDHSTYSGTGSATFGQGKADGTKNTGTVVFPKYCIGCHTILGRLYIGGESDVLDVVRIG